MREPVRFTVRQAARRGSVGRYRLRGSSVQIHVRHNTPDLNTLDEIFLGGHYAMPAPARTALADASPLAVLDLGANVGLFAASIFVVDPGASVVSFEPDPDNAALLRSSIAANPQLDWELVEACASNRAGEVAFSTGLFTGSRMDPGGDRTLPALDVFPYAAEATFVKMDIEGAEWEILGDDRFSEFGARVLALEYHEHRAPSGDPARHARAALERGGYATAEGDFPLPEGHGMLWGWRDE